jgi:dTDP-4-amino-4,6-dideoxygalactose transaminase
VGEEHLSFNRPTAGNRELGYVAEAIENAHLSGDGPFTMRCQEWLRGRIGSEAALLVHSCTAALELAALLLEVGPGDEVIMPSFTFVSTANAFALRGAVPVFVDIQPETLNLDPDAVAAALTPGTKAIVPVHYAGVPAPMAALLDLAGRNGVVVVEDAAQALLSTYEERPAGGLGALAALSFHETKNVVSGEGGALLVNHPDFARRAEILRDKGTDRKRFLRGEVDKYTWVDLGSSYAMSEINAAFLWAQLEQAEELTSARRRLWKLYHEALGPLEADGRLRRPVVPANVVSNAHIYYVLAATAEERDRLLEAFRDANINAVFHYAPLHASVAGRRYGRAHGSLPVTEDLASRLIRLPLWPAMTQSDVDRVTSTLYGALDRAPLGRASQ